MKHLMKYEFRKTLIAKLIILGTTAVLEILFLLGLYTKHDSLAGYSTIMLTMLAFGGVLFIGLQSVMTLHRDMNTKQSYMLFMTPNSSYKILGAKVLENGLSILMACAFFFASPRMRSLSVTTLRYRATSSGMLLFKSSSIPMITSLSTATFVEEKVIYLHSSIYCSISEICCSILFAAIAAPYLRSGHSFAVFRSPWGTLQS